LNFNTGKEQLLARYRLGAEQALTRADFLHNPDLFVLQAFAIYLAVLQHTGETSSAWVLVGVLIRVAVSRKLQQDGSHTDNIKPFEEEMRRRLWWQICLIDSRSEAKQVSKFKLSESMFDTDIPANTDDADIDQEMTSAPAVVEKWTDMTVLIIRCEVWRLSRRIQSIMAASDISKSNVDKCLELFRQSQATIESQYLRHLDPDCPLHSFMAATTRLFFTKVDVILHAKYYSARASEPRSVDTSQNYKLFISLLLIVEYTYALQNEPGWNGWRWQIEGQQPPWHALRIVLDQLCTCHWNAVCQRALLSIRRFMDSIPELIRNDSRYQQLLVVQATLEEKITHSLLKQTVDEDIDLHPAAAFNLPTSLDVGRKDIIFMPQELSLAEPDGLGEKKVSELLDLQMDWQAWDEIAREQDPSFEFGSWLVFD
jgi:hypothetical protein